LLATNLHQPIIVKQSIPQLFIHPDFYCLHDKRTKYYLSRVLATATDPHFWQPDLQPVSLLS
jgi:hypothetical protein